GSRRLSRHLLHARPEKLTIYSRGGQAMFPKVHGGPRNKPGAARVFPAKHPQTWRRTMSPAKDQAKSLNRRGLERRGLLKCMAWPGAGILGPVSGGVPRSSLIGEAEAGEGLAFVQISDTHIGFNKPANPDTAGTMKAAVDRIAALSPRPAFL